MVSTNPFVDLDSQEGNYTSFPVEEERQQDGLGNANPFVNLDSQEGNYTSFPAEEERQQDRLGSTNPFENLDLHEGNYASYSPIEETWQEGWLRYPPMPESASAVGGEVCSLLTY